LIPAIDLMREALDLAFSRAPLLAGGSERTDLRFRLAGFIIDGFRAGHASPGDLCSYALSQLIEE
jgi:hypothetical protein